MKKILTALVLTVVTSVSAFAGNANPTNEKVLKAFSTNFSTAINVTWSEMPEQGLYHASFVSNAQQLDAFYTEDGELVATARAVEAKQLPVSVTQRINEMYPGGKTDDNMLECTLQGYTSYYVTVRTEKATLILKADADGTVSVFKKQRITI